MKVYIVQELQEYKIYKVAENLIKEFEVAKKDCVVVQGGSIQEVIIAFDNAVKVEGLEFIPKLVKYKVGEKEDVDETNRKKITHRQKI